MSREHHDITNEEILRHWEDVERDPVKLWRTAVACTARAEMAPGVINNKHSDQFGFYPEIVK